VDNVFQMAFSNVTPDGQAWHPWHSSTQLAYEGAFNYREAMADSALGGIHVDVEPIMYAGRRQTRKNLLIWREKQEVVGFVHDGYVPVQPSDLMGGFLDGMGMSVDADIFHTAGILNDGRYWGLVYIDNEDFKFVVGGSTMLTYLCLLGINDGKHACLAFTTTTRVECQNTMEAAITAALLGERPLVSFKHDVNVKDAIKGGAKLLGLAGPRNSLLRKAYQTLANTPLVGGAFNAFVAKMLPSKVEGHPDGNTAENVDRERQLVMRAYDDSKNYNPTWEGSWLHAYSAFADYITHLRTETKRRGLSKSRFDSAMFGHGSELLAMANEYCLAQVGFTPDLYGDDDASD